MQNFVPKVSECINHEEGILFSLSLNLSIKIHAIYTCISITGSSENVFFNRFSPFQTYFLYPLNFGPQGVGPLDLVTFVYILS